MKESLWTAASIALRWSSLRAPWGRSSLIAKRSTAASALATTGTAAEVALARVAVSRSCSPHRSQLTWPPLPPACSGNVGSIRVVVAEGTKSLHGGSWVAFQVGRGPSSFSHQQRFFGVGGSYGYGAFFRGDADAAGESNMGRQRLQQEDTNHVNITQQGLFRLKMPETLATLVAEGALQKPIRRSGVSVYHHHLPENPDRSLMYLSATNRQGFASVAAAAESLVQQRERGVATQLILDGRGVKAYFDPEWPDLMVRLGVGVKPLALRRLAEQYATKAKIFIDKRGLLLTIHGWDKRAVGTLTMELYRHLKANPYTAKGARIAFYPVNKKVSSKK